MATTGNFFAVDRRSWALVCSKGINAAGAYLVLACFSGRDNRTTAASVNAVERYLGISRGRAAASLDLLQGSRFILKTRGGTCPRYELLPAVNVPGGPKSPEKPRRKRRETEEHLHERLSEWEAAMTLIKEPEWIWLPKELVTGAADEVPPVARIRQTQDPMTLRLLVDLYHAQDLPEEGGVGRREIYQTFERLTVGQRGPFRVWGFRLGSMYVGWGPATRCHRRESLTAEEKKAGRNGGVDFFPRLEQLVSLGLVEWVPMLLEGDGAEAECLHPFGMGGTECLEDRIGAAAHSAARMLLTDGQVNWAADEELWLAPVQRHIANVQMVGVARLRYRPHTSRTAAWWADLTDKGNRWLHRYRAMEEADRPTAMHA